MISDAFVAELLTETRCMSAAPPDERLQPLRAEVTAITVKIGRMTELAAESTAPRPFLEKVEGLERRREKIAGELRALEDQQNAADVLRAISDERHPHAAGQPGGVSARGRPRVAERDDRRNGGTSRAMRYLAHRPAALQVCSRGFGGVPTEKRCLLRQPCACFPAGSC